MIYRDVDNLDQASGFDILRPLSEFKEEEATWLISSLLPEGQITLLAAEGGVGKTTICCNIVAALSSGKRCFLDSEAIQRDPIKIAFLTTEDSVSKVLKRKLKLAGANEDNILFLDCSNMPYTPKFGSDLMKAISHTQGCKFFIFDPIQSFVPPNVSMASRNEMRNCLAPLIALGEETGATSLVVAHTNKRKGAFGRDRIADSADLWDISRSVIVAGKTGTQNVHYLSNEKNNYAPLQKTILYSINDAGQINVEGTSWKQDREYQLELQSVIAAPKREECTAFILSCLQAEGGRILSSSLDTKAMDAGFRAATLRRSKDALKKDGFISYKQTYQDGTKQWNTILNQEYIASSP